MTRQILCFAPAIIGFMGTILVCALPMWKVTICTRTEQTLWEGLWMNCVILSTGQMQWRVCDSMLALPQDLQAARVLTVIAIVVAALGVLLGVARWKFTNFVKDETARDRVTNAAGVVFIVAGVLELIPVCWSANTITRDSYNPIMTQRSGVVFIVTWIANTIYNIIRTLIKNDHDHVHHGELGAALYIGWATAGLLILAGGSLLCSQAWSTATGRASEIVVDRVHVTLKELELDQDESKAIMFTKVPENRELPQTNISTKPRTACEMTAETQEIIVVRIHDALRELDQDEFKLFKWYLGNSNYLEGLEPLPKDSLENADKMKTADLIVGAYPEKKVPIVINVLRKLKREDLVRRF